MSATCFISKRDVSNSTKANVNYLITTLLISNLTGLNDAVNEVFPWNKLVVILIHLPEQISEPALLVVHELEEPLPPVVP